MAINLHPLCENWRPASRHIDKESVEHYFSKSILGILGMWVKESINNSIVRII